MMLLLTALALVAGIAFSELAGDTAYKRVYQHRSSMQPDEIPKGEANFTTHLPIITIQTNGLNVPGVRLPHVQEDVKQYTLAANGDTRIVADFAMYDSGGANRLSDTATVSSRARIRYRGNYSRSFYKKSYAFSLVGADGQSQNPQPLGNLPEHDEWVLHGPWIDRTLVRNYLCYNIAGEVMAYAPNVRFVELFVNDEYNGVYLLVEPITKGRGRLDLKKPDDGKDITSFIVRWDRANKGDQRLNNFSQYTNRADLSALDVRYPGKQVITPGRMKYIEQTISTIEKTLYSANAGEARKNYTSYLDLNSFAQYFVLNEFFRNVDAGRYSTFLYKDMRSKVGLVVWDFDNAFDNNIDHAWNEQGFTIQDTPWFSMLLMDEVFVNKVIDEYRRLREGPLNEGYLLRTIDETVTYLGDAVARNYQKWDRAFNLNAYNGLDYLIPVERNYKTHAESVEQLKSFIIARGRWLDDHIETLRQYCQDSKNSNILIH
jgi:spore coat protein H